MPRPRICWFCTESGTVAVVDQRNAVTLRLDGTARRFVETVSRFVCPSHERLDPWEAV